MTYAYTTIVLTLADYFRAIVERRDAGHTLASHDEVMLKQMGFADWTAEDSVGFHLATLKRTEPADLAELEGEFVTRDGKELEADTLLLMLRTPIGRALILQPVIHDENVRQAILQGRKVETIHREAQARKKAKRKPKAKPRRKVKKVRK